jgi:DNA-binding response OmpR family regulator
VTIRVLVVDDKLEFARHVAEAVTTNTGLRSEYAATPEAACALVEQNPIAVAVLDQKMPLMSGTELFARLSRIRPDLRVIMLTAEADVEDLAQALKLRYHDYLTKSRISELPEHVAAQYLQHLVATQGGYRSAEIVWPRKILGRRWRRTEITLLATQDLGAQTVDPNGWTAVLQLNSGEESRVKYEVVHSTSRSLEAESMRALKGVLSLKAKTLAAAASSIVDYSVVSTMRAAEIIGRTATQVSERILALPNDRDQGAANFVRARLFQQARIQRKIVVTLQARCRCCGISSVVPVVILEDTDFVATRHQDYLNDGTVTTFDTGIVAAAPLGATS